uniref:Hydroxysteroid 17-beta dehydrogenase 11 n=1 Tax=Bursaphelenchus xylophilus TaxID=6326 RepID=A0A1I7SAJ8_BURXY
MALAHGIAVVLHETLQFGLFLGRFTGNLLYGTVRALIPSGVLPRKCVRDKVFLITGSASGIGRLCALKVTKAFLPRMLEKDEGHIVTMASIAGHAGLIGLTDYCASKHAAVGFMAALYRELYNIGSNVQTTTVSPYYINTGMFDGVTESKLFPVCPILQPEYVADRIVDAVLTNTPHLILPRFLYIIKFVGTFLPQSCTDAIYDYTNTDRTMLTFKGRIEEIAKSP